MFHFYNRSISISAVISQLIDSSMYCYGLSAFQSMLSNQGSSFIATRTLLLFSHIYFSGLLIFRGKKSKISRDFQGQIRGKIGRFRGIFAGKKSKFAEQSADFRRFSQEKSQNSQENRPISRDFSGKESIFEGFSGANNFLRIS